VNESDVIPASCLCGGVRLELTPPFLLASYCHCEHCRKHLGNFGSASIEVPIGQMRLLSGEELLGRWQPAPGLAVKVFCTRCGSSLYGAGARGRDGLGAYGRPRRGSWAAPEPACLGQVGARLVSGPRGQAAALCRLASQVKARHGSAVKASEGERDA
jgi:hypothetical protein